MKLTQKEQNVIEILIEWKIATKQAMCRHLHISHMTVVRALKKYGYYSSCNKNSSFYTLQGIPVFNNGLWTYKGIRFSKFGTLTETMVALIENSLGGCTVNELKKILGTDVGNILSLLCNQKRLDRCYVGRYMVYISINRQRKLQQKIKRQQQTKEAQISTNLEESQKKELPEGIDSLKIISALIQIIKTPKASTATISRLLQQQGVTVDATQVRNIVDFYSLKKKRKIEHCSPR